jgi:hypothetical protein
MNHDRDIASDIPTFQSTRTKTQMTTQLLEAGNEVTTVLVIYSYRRAITGSTRIARRAGM